MSSTLRVMSVNLWWGKASADALLARVREFEVHALCCCQELGFEQAKLDPEDWPELQAPIELATTHFAAPHVTPYGLGLRTRSRQAREIENDRVQNPGSGACSSGTSTRRRSGRRTGGLHPNGPVLRLLWRR